MLNFKTANAKITRLLFPYKIFMPCKAMSVTWINLMSRINSSQCKKSITIKCFNIAWFWAD